MREIEGMLRDRGIPLRIEEKKEQLDQIAPNHQGIIAFAEPRAYASLDDIFALAAERNEDPFVIILDELEDPHNLGAIMRSAECAGAHGVIVEKRKAAGLTETVAKASAGAVEYIPCAQVTNIARTLDELKDRGLWIGGADMGDTNFWDQSLTGPIGIVIGNEGKGIRRLVREKCDFILSIPMKGRINSLNASNAAAILMYEIRRQRDAR